MKDTKQLGIWMDHSIAFIMELTNDTIVRSIIISEFTKDEKEVSLSKGENFMNSKKQHLQSNFFKKLSEVIRNYSEVLLFGPTDAKAELVNILKDNHLFDNITFVVKQSDKMTENQMNAFVKEHFGIK